MTTCRNTYGGYGSYLRSRGYDKSICLLASDIENGIVKAGAINISSGAVNTIQQGGGTGSNIAINTGTGQIYRDTSSKRYKKDIHPVVLDDAQKILDISAKNYVYKSEPHTQRSGFIAEELDGVDYLKRFVVYNAEGLPDGVNYDKIVAPLLEIVRDNKNRITDLEAQLKTALDRITALENK